PSTEFYPLSLHDALPICSDVMTWEKGAHGSTYAGNPVCCASALATFELLEGGLVEDAARIGTTLFAGLAELQARQPLIREVRGRDRKSTRLNPVTVRSRM